MIGAAQQNLTSGWLTGDIDSARIAIGGTNDSAAHLLYLLQQVKSAKTFETQSAAIVQTRKYLNSIGVTLENSEGAAQALMIQITQSEDAALRLGYAVKGVPGHISASVTMSTDLNTALRESAAGAALVAGANMAGNIGAALAPAMQLSSVLWDAANAAAQGRNAGAKVKRIPGGVDALANGDIQASGGNYHRPIIYTPPKTGGGSAGGGAADKTMAQTITERTKALQEEASALRAVASGMFQSEDAAKLYGEAMIAGNGVIDAGTMKLLEQADAAAILNEQLQRAARDPVKEFLQSVPLWEEASRSIQGSIVNNMSDILANFFKTGKLNLADFASSVAGTMADILAKQTTGAILGKFGITGAISGGNETARGGQQAAGMIGSSMIHAGQVVSNLLHGSLVSGARTVGGTVTTTMSTSGYDAGNKLKKGVESGAANGGQNLAQMLISALSGGGSGGGFLDVVAGVVGGMFSEGGYSDQRAMSTTVLSPAAWNAAPHYAEGTPNTSGIPAVLHANEAVIPLSRGRKIPVEMSGGGGGSTSTTIGDLNTYVTIEGAGGDLSDPKHAQAMADQVATMINLKVKESLSDAMRYGGMANPRGGR